MNSWIFAQEMTCTYIYMADTIVAVWMSQQKSILYVVQFNELCQLLGEYYIHDLKMNDVLIDYNVPLVVCL